jgi:uncharacterized membrane protein YgcG
MFEMILAVLAGTVTLLAFGAYLMYRKAKTDEAQRAAAEALHNRSLEAANKRWAELTRDTYMNPDQRDASKRRVYPQPLRTREEPCRTHHHEDDSFTSLLNAYALTSLLSDSGNSSTPTPDSFEGGGGSSGGAGASGSWDDSSSSSSSSYDSDSSSSSSSDSDSGGSWDSGDSGGSCGGSSDF